MFSSKLKGLNVYNQKDESVGEITDLAVKNHQVEALILSVGGFLGIGEHYVAVSRRRSTSATIPRTTSGGVDEHHQGSTEGGAGVQVSEVSVGFL
jgi:sporulation protein YlmC with PRC-barrel domain